MDIFEEAAKLRAARRIWAKLLSERYGVPAERAAINLFVYTLGGALTAQEPENNIVRVTCEALAAVLGGVQTLATSSYDEALGLPTPEAAMLALRTQQVLAHESGAARVVDPLGGSYYVEELTDLLEAEILEQAADIAQRGCPAAAIASGHLHRLLADSAYEYQAEVESGRAKVVGVNVHRSNERPSSEAPSGSIPRSRRISARRSLSCGSRGMRGRSPPRCRRLPTRRPTRRTSFPCSVPRPRHARRSAS